MSEPLVNPVSRRSFLIGTSAVTASVALSGCSFGGSSGEGSSSGPLRMASFQPADVVKVFKGQFADFAKKSGTEVKHEYASRTAQNQALLTQATSGTLPDVGLISADTFPSLASRGLLEPLDGFDFGNFSFADQPKVLQNLYKFEGQTFGVGTDLDLGLLFYNIDLFEKAGVDVPTPETTYDQFRDIAKELTAGKGSGKYYGLDTQGFSGAYLLMSAMAWSMGGQLMDTKAKKVTVTDGPGREALELIANMFGTDKSIPPPNSDRTTITNGRVAMGMYGAWGAYYMLDKAKFKWGVTQLPRAKTQVTYGSGSCLVMFKSSKKKKKAAEFIDFFLQDKIQLQRADDFAWTPPMGKVLSSSHFGERGALTLTGDQKTVINDAAASARALAITNEQTKVYGAMSDVLTGIAADKLGAAGAAKKLTATWQPLLEA